MLTLMDWFAGAGGSSQGAHAVPGVEVTLAANHWQLAMDSHASNFPKVLHKVGDIRELNVYSWPVSDLFWASPECTKWSLARGKKRTFHNSLQEILFDLRTDEEREADEAEDRSRALMMQVPQYLAGVQARGALVKAGVVENVIDERAWDGWDLWLASIRSLGYQTRTIAFNSMHAQGTRTPRAPQSRDRLYVAYWHESLGRDPDWDKWLRPRAYCETCDEHVYAIQVFKRAGQDMGRYRQSYSYRCPRARCRNAVIEPDTLPASAAIDWTIPAPLIGERLKTTAKPQGLKPATIDRIMAGMDRHWLPLLAAAETEGRANVPPLLVPLEGRDGKRAWPVTEQHRCQTGRNETGLALPPLPPFIVKFRGGGDKLRSCGVGEPLHTVSAEGNHHGLVPSVLPSEVIDIDSVPFRMLTAEEICRAMAFRDGYVVLGSSRDQVRQAGNAVTPPVAELLVSALTEAVTGEEITRNEEAA